MQIFEIKFQGVTHKIKAEDDQQAVRKFAADFTGQDCECGFAAWGEDAAAEGQELCECVEWVRD